MVSSGNTWRATGEFSGRVRQQGMRLMSRTAGLIALSLVATACSGPSSPSAPSPLATVAPELSPADLAGTWETGAGAFMNITQTGTVVSGIQLPATMELGTMTAVTTGTVTGLVSGDNVSLQLHDTVTVNRRGDTLICRGADSFTGQVSGDLLTGILISGTTRYVCEGGIALPTPQISGPMIFVRR